MIAETRRSPRSGLFPQLLLDVHQELIVDLFAGGGGASLGVEMATGRQVDHAVNHDPPACSLHQANHPQTVHHVSDVFEADPREITGGRPIGLLWASPDCTFHSKARGGKPFRDSAKKRRALAWVVTRWAGQVRPRVIALENVEEFAQWGPLVGAEDEQRPCPKRRGRTFRKWVRSLERLGYKVEHKELRACDYGAPTIRKRLFVIARCDGKPIVWPEPTHGEGKGLRPYRTAAECIDWSIPMLSIFATREEARAWGKAHRQASPKRPLAEATMRRIARGVQRFVLEAAEPFIVPLTHGRDSFRGQPLSEPLRTVTGARRGEQAVVAPIIAGVGGRAGQSPERSVEDPYQTITAKGDAALVAPYLVPRYGERDGQEPRTRSIEEPAPVVVPTGNGASLVASFLARHWGGMVGKELGEPHPTVLTKGAQDQLVAAHISKFQENGDGTDPREPLHTVLAGAPRHAAVAAFLQSYYGTEVQGDLNEPIRTIPATDRFGLVTVEIQGVPYAIIDIAMRMLQPRELYRAQGFPDEYRIDRGADGRKLTKTEQVRMVGNSVSPQVACAIVAANCPELVARDEVRWKVASA